MSNVLGTVTPAERIVAMAHAHGAKVLFDGSQAAVHRRVDVQAIGADFYVFTGHKLYGPTGIGVLWARSGDRKSTRLNSSHANISYAVFCLKKTKFHLPLSRAFLLLS